jgi:hypothetical protein
MSGTGVSPAQITATSIIATPLQRSGVFNSPMTRSPAVPRRSGPVPKAVTRPKAPGRLATHSATASIQSMP